MTNKKIVSSAIVFLLTFSLLVVGVTAQASEDCNEEFFEFEGGATLTLYGVVGEVTATGVPTYNYPPLPPPESDDERPSIIGAQQLTTLTVLENEEYPSWDIRVTGQFGTATVGLPWQGEGQPLVEMYQIDLIRGDINQDGTVDCKDVKILTRAYGSSQYSRIRYLRVRYNPNCDLNNDHKVNLRDLCILLKHFGQTAEWQPLDNVIFDETSQMIYGDTDHFSIFRCR